MERVISFKNNPLRQILIINYRSYTNKCEHKIMSGKFKFSTLRQFGSENISFTSEIESENCSLSKEQIKEQIDMFNTMINEAFISVQEREISEKALLVKASEKRRAEVAKLDEALKQEMDAKKAAEITMSKAEKESKKLTSK